MVAALFQVCIVVGLFTQAATSAPLRFGPTAEHLSDADVLAIGKLVDGPEKLWALIGQSPGLISGRWFINAFLVPDVRTPVLRRGHMRTVLALMTAGSSYESHGPWSIQAEARYAQVPVPGTDPDQLTSRRDLNRPFRVAGEFSDEEIVALVTFLRGSPKGPAVAPLPNGRGTTPRVMLEVQGAWPIVAVFKSGAEIRASLLDHDAREQSGQSITLRRDGNAWVIERLTMWISD